MIALGTIIGGDFRILQPLSEGGMGAVFVAEQISTGRNRAVKLMKRELVADAQLRARFVLEAKAGGRISSEHVVEVLAAGVTEEGQPWLAMELLSGQSLHDLVSKRGRLDLSGARTIMSHVCHAIAAAHRVGIVHRDLKPENIFVADTQREGATFMAKVLDFGIAKVVADSQSIGLSQTASLGTPLWMAPEQAESRGVISPATDLWPLGLIAFFILTGKEYWLVAHTNGSIAALVREIAIEALAPATVRAAELGVAGLLPAGFDAWFSQCVHRSARDRFPSVDAAKDAFLALQPDVALDATLPGPVLPARRVPLADADPLAATAANAPELSSLAEAPTFAAVVSLSEAPTLAAPTPAAVSRTPPRAITPKRQSKALWVIGSAALLFITVLGVGIKIYPLLKKHDDPKRASERELAPLLRDAKFIVPATSPEAGALLRLEKTDAWWGAELPLVTVVLFCSFTEPTCAVITRELDAIVADPTVHAQVRWRHAVRTGDAPSRLAAEAAQGAFETGGTQAFLRFRDLALAYAGVITPDIVGGWARQLGLPDPDDYAIRLKRGDWKAGVDRDVAAYAGARIGSPGFAWANCEARGLAINDAGRLRDDVVRFLKEKPSGELDLAKMYIERCLPSENKLLVLNELDLSPYASAGSAEWAKRIALDWATAFANRNVAALKATYAPRVLVGGKDTARADVVSAKQAHFERAPALRAAIASSILVTPKDSGYVVELTRAERTASDTRAERAKLGIRSTPDGWAIVEETIASDSSCAAVVLAALVDRPAVGAPGTAPGPSSGEPMSLPVVDHALIGHRATLTVREMVAGRVVDTHEVVWDLSLNRAAADFDAQAQPQSRTADSIARACSKE